MFSGEAVAVHCWQVQVPAGTLLAGFGRGRWERAPEGGDLGKKISYGLSDYNTDVILEGKIAKLIDVVNTRRQKDPTCKVAYHDMRPIADGPPGAFSVTRTHHVVFSPGGPEEGEGGEEGAEDGAKKPPAVLQASAAITAPPLQWAQSDLVSIRFAVKWAASGLMPIRPQVCTNYTLVLPPSKAIQVL